MMRTSGGDRQIAKCNQEAIYRLMFGRAALRGQEDYPAGHGDNSASGPQGGAHNETLVDRGAVWRRCIPLRAAAAPFNRRGKPIEGLTIADFGKVDGKPVTSYTLTNSSGMSSRSPIYPGGQDKPPL